MILAPDYAVGDSSEVAAGGGQSGSREPGYGVGDVIREQGSICCNILLVDRAHAPSDPIPSLAKFLLAF
jgi:hypothetical protein